MNEHLEPTHVEVLYHSPQNGLALMNGIYIHEANRAVVKDGNLILYKKNKYTDHSGRERTSYIETVVYNYNFVVRYEFHWRNPNE